MGPDQVARLIAEADRCIAEATHIRDVAATIDRRHVAQDLLKIAAHLEQTSGRLRSIADQMR